MWRVWNESPVTVHPTALEFDLCGIQMKLDNPPRAALDKVCLGISRGDIPLMVDGFLECFDEADRGLIGMRAVKMGDPLEMEHVLNACHLINDHFGAGANM